MKTLLFGQGGATPLDERVTHSVRSARRVWGRGESALFQIHNALAPRAIPIHRTADEFRRPQEKGDAATNANRFLAYRAPQPRGVHFLPRRADGPRYPHLGAL